MRPKQLQKNCNFFLKFCIIYEFFTILGQMLVCIMPLPMELCFIFKRLLPLNPYAIILIKYFILILLLCLNTLFALKFLMISLWYSSRSCCELCLWLRVRTDNRCELSSGTKRHLKEASFIVALCMIINHQMFGAEFSTRAGHTHVTHI